MRPGSIKEATRLQGYKPYGEESRRYRRTIYRHEDWLNHRSETRLLRNLKGTFTSGVVRSLLSEVAAVALASVLIIVWNSALFGYNDLSNVAQPGLLSTEQFDFLRASLPVSIFTLSSPALGLLLVFRTNTSYSRWLEARQAWGRIVSHCRNIMRQATVWIDDNDPNSRRALDELSLCVWAFPRSLWAHLSDPAKEPRYAEELTDAMGAEAAASLLDATHRPLRALSLLSAAMDRLPIDEKKKVEMDKSIILLGDACEVCERIFASPVPLVYTRHTARFLSLWLLLLPLGLWDGFGSSWNHIALVPTATVLSIFLFGIDELAVQLEEPFSILPLEALCADVKSAASNMLAGMPSTREPLPIPSDRTPANRPSTSRSGNVQMLLPLVADVGLGPLSEAGSVMNAASALNIDSQHLAALSTIETQERYFVAGGLCASISHALATPVDVVKTRQQTVDSYANLSLLDGLRRVASEGGVAGLFTGVVPTVVGYGAEGALKFGSYEALKPVTLGMLVQFGCGPDTAASLGPIVSAVIAGGLASLVLAPAEATRIRMVSDATYSELGLLDAASRLYATEGAAGLLRGVPATCSKQLPYTATKQVTFDALIDAAARSSLLLPRWASTGAAAAAAAVLSTIASQPGDAILSEVSKGGAAPTDRSIGGAIAHLGTAGLARGLQARLVQVGVIVTVQLILYDTLKHAFGVP